MTVCERYAGPGDQFKAAEHGRAALGFESGSAGKQGSELILKEKCLFPTQSERQSMAANEPPAVGYSVERSWPRSNTILQLRKQCEFTAWSLQFRFAIVRPSIDHGADHLCHPSQPQLDKIFCQLGSATNDTRQ